MWTCDCPHPSLSTTDGHYPWFGFVLQEAACLWKCVMRDRYLQVRVSVHSKGRKAGKQQALQLLRNGVEWGCGGNEEPQGS